MRACPSSLACLPLNFGVRLSVWCFTGKNYKEFYEPLGYKKLTESLRAIDTLLVEGDTIKLKSKK